CTARLLPPDAGDEQPQLELGWSRDLVGMDGMELRRRLLEGSPRIMLDDMSAGADRLVIEPFRLQPGEADIVGQAIARTLGAAADGSALSACARARRTWWGRRLPARWARHRCCRRRRGTRPPRSRATGSSKWRCCPSRASMFCS